MIVLVESLEEFVMRDVCVKVETRSSWMDETVGGSI